MVEQEKFRQQNPEVVEIADAFWRQGQLEKVVSTIQDFTDLATPLSEQEIRNISYDYQQLRVLSTLVRLYVDSLKTLANKSISPRGIYSLLSTAASAIETYLRHPRLQYVLKGDQYIYRVESDHLGREHHFWAEMRRDEAKTMMAGQVLAPRNDQLTRAGEEMLITSAAQLKDGHPTAPLMRIEAALSQLKRGRSINKDIFFTDFQAIVDHYLSPHSLNPERVRTVAIWLITVGEKTHDEEMRVMGWIALHRLQKPQSSFEELIEAERKKLEKAATRSLVVGMLSLVHLSAEERVSLTQRLLPKPISEQE